MTPEGPDHTMTLAERHAIPIDICTDGTGEVMRRYRLRHPVDGSLRELYLERFGLDLARYNGEGRWELPVPATYVVDRDGTVRAGQADPDYRVRMEPWAVIEALRALR